jgi:hypothetical protein
MKAIIMDRHGGLDVLRYGDLQDPVAEEGQSSLHCGRGHFGRECLFPA